MAEVMTEGGSLRRLCWIVHNMENISSSLLIAGFLRPKLMDRLNESFFLNQVIHQGFNI
jgi:hypothetical protein